MIYDRSVTHARDERAALCALLDRTGPAGPTLCDGWRTADLAAHLVLRERRPDAAAGMLGGPLERRTRRLQQDLTGRTAFPELVQAIRTGPPRASVFGLPGMDERLNVVEYFVHHEDVRRAAADWQPRELSASLADALWDRLKIARLILRKAPVGVQLARDDKTPGGQQRAAAGRQGPERPARIRAKAGTPVVTVTGTPAELTLWVSGRTGAARVRLAGAEAGVTALSQPGWRH